MAQKKNPELEKLQEKARKQGLSIRGKNSKQLQAMLDREEEKAKAKKGAEKKALKETKPAPAQPVAQTPTPGPTQPPKQGNGNLPWWVWLIIGLVVVALVNVGPYFLATRPQNALQPGPQGPQGQPGLQGIQGDKGDKGDKGDTGASGVVTVIVEKVVTKEVEKVVTATPPPATPTNTPVPSATPTWTPAPTQVPAAPVSTCRDGEVIGVHRNLLERTPIGLKENTVVVQLAWKGTGFGGWDRAVLVVPTLGENTQVFAHTDTVHMTRHCGTITEVEYYAGQPATYVWAMRATAADSVGNMPIESEIGVYSVNLTDGTLKVLKSASTGPSVEEVRNHIEVVHLTGSAVTSGSTPITSSSTAACPEATLIGSWNQAQNLIFTGPVIANLWWPLSGSTQEVRTLVPSGKKVTFLQTAGSAWQFAATCSAAQLQSELTRASGNLPIVSIDDLVTQGKAARK